MTVTVEKRIAALERENADLKARLEALQLLLSGNKPTPPRRVAPQVQITNPLPRVMLPNDEQCRQLCDIVLQRYPSLRPRRGEEEEFAAEFRAAIRFVEHHGRRAQLDRDRGIGWWIDTARDWLSQHGGNSLIGGNAFIAAIVATGDVQHSDPREPGFVIGLQHTGGGRETSAQWHTVLSTGRLLDPVPPERPKPAFSPVSIADGR